MSDNPAARRNREARARKKAGLCIHPVEIPNTDIAKQAIEAKAKELVNELTGEK